MAIRADAEDGDYRSRRSYQRQPRDYDPLRTGARGRGWPPIFHIKQSLMDKGGFRPFAAEPNCKGRIQPKPLLAALRESVGENNEICLELSFKQREPADRCGIAGIAESIAFMGASY